MAKTKLACGGDTLFLDQMSCLIDWIGGYLPTARKRLRLDLFSEDKREDIGSGSEVNRLVSELVR
jgi:hypothetical protein